MASTDPTEIFIKDLTRGARDYATHLSNQSIAAANTAATVIASLQVDQSPLDEFRPPQISVPHLRNTSEDFRDVPAPSEISVPTPPSLSQPNLNGFLSSAVGLNSGDIPTIDAEIGDHRTPLAPIPFTHQPPVVDLSVGEIPDVPDLQLPEAPAEIEITIPPEPFIDIPGNSNLTRPEINIDPTQVRQTAERMLEVFRELRTDMQGHIESSLSNVLDQCFPNLGIQRDKMDEYLTDFLCGNTTALTTEIEEQIYRRQRDRAVLEQMRLQEEVEGRAARTNNPIMPASTHALLLQVAESQAVNITEVNLAATEQQAKRQLDQIRYVIDTVMKLKELYLNQRTREYELLLQVNQAALRGGQQYADILVNAYNVTLAVFRAELELFNAELAELRSIREFAVLQLDVYKTKLQAEEIKSNINRDRVDAYRARIDGVSAIYNATNQRITALVNIAELKKAPLEVFRAQADAYRAYISGVEADVGVYQALINADVAVLEGQISQVRAFGTLKDIEIKDKELQLEVVRVASQYNELRLQQYQAELAFVELQKNIDALTIDAAKAGLDSDLDKYRIQAGNAIEEFKAVTSIKVAQADLNRQYASEFGNLSLGFQQLLQSQATANAAVLNSAASTLGDIGAAALAGINNIASVSSQTNFEG